MQAVCVERFVGGFQVPVANHGCLGWPRTLVPWEQSDTARVE